MSTTLAIDFGEKYIGLALVAHSSQLRNQVLYAVTLTIDPGKLRELSENRALMRRIRRTTRTHKRRLDRLAQALQGIPHAAKIVRFCRRRGYSHDPEETTEEEAYFRVSREQFFHALHQEAERLIDNAALRERALACCDRHLNAERQPGRELRPARFDNRGRSRCQWEACQHNVPRSSNAVRERLIQALFAWLLPAFDEVSDKTRLRKSVDHWIGELAGMATAYRKSGHDETRRKDIQKSVQQIYRKLIARVLREAPVAGASFAENWKEHYRENVSGIIYQSEAGRIRYCREHSQQFVDHIIAGKVIPNRQDITEADLFARTQQILFRRLWRFVEARLLPLAGGRIDRVVVERVAFDVICGKYKDRQKTKEPEAYRIYSQGPQAGFASRLEMLRAEFDGRCAYCGEQGKPILEVEHILNRADFPFDSYFNLVPSCAECNHAKGSRTALAAGRTLHSEAYAAYSAYLRTKKILHPWQLSKKGLLNLMTRWSTLEDAQRAIGMLASNLVSITNTQRSPRPLARYLATHLEQNTKVRPEIRFRAGRHTALFRSIILPDYEKQELRDVGDLRQHAVDAIILGSELPDATVMENKDWTRTAEDFRRWRDKVIEAAPVIGSDGFPVVAFRDFLSGFERDLGSGYGEIPIHQTFNWNRRRKATHKQGPAGKTRDGRPFQRKPAANLLVELMAGGPKRQNAINSVAHKSLREKLAASPEVAAEVFVRWLQKSVVAGLQRAEMSNHPADQTRKRMLEEFASRPVSEVVESRDGNGIPGIIGIRRLSGDTGGALKVSIPRCVDGNPTAQWYPSEANIREIHVCYRAQDGRVNLDKPSLIAVNQVGCIRHFGGQKFDHMESPEGSPLSGRSFGTGLRESEFWNVWQTAFDDLLIANGIGTRFVVTQGMVIEKQDGTKFLLRNFASENWKIGDFKHIRRVYRSPLRAMRTDS